MRLWTCRHPATQSDLLSPTATPIPTLTHTLQCVLTPADPYMPRSNEEIAAEVDKQARGGTGPPATGLRGWGGGGAGAQRNGSPHMPLFTRQNCAMQVRRLFPSATGLKMLWHSVVKIGQSL